MSTTRSRRHPSWLVFGVMLTAFHAGLGHGMAQMPDPRAMAVSVVIVRPHCFHDRVTASGTFAPKQNVELRPPRDGLLISEVFVDPGDVVTADQVLARLVSSQDDSRETVAIKAPVNGTVIAVSTPVGAYASSTSGPAMFRIMSEAGLELRADILGPALGRLKIGMPARLHVVGLGDIDGHVSSIGSAIDPVTQFGSVSLTVADTHPRVGAFARADIEVGEDCGLIIPLSALLSGPEGEVVGVVHGDRVEMRPVKIGLLEAGNAEVRDGLNENEAVIARAGAFLREGDHVRAIPVAAIDAGAR